MRFLHKLDEIQSIYKFYRLCLSQNMRQALILYFAVLIGFLVYLFKAFWLRPELADNLLLIAFQTIVVVKGYGYFRDVFLDLHSPE
ncbi:hypothetical protein P7L95_09815 [Bisgaard Taxon 10/6]|uniref:hypothetical protein n=1 Tax=Exercitatus varius TaxID=67857 RepID=UPI00294AF3D2|nr:hypothetical protein [Exercitatus varius]MDG2957037.1 hypothetical protein [Exercitatus varius]MDG2965275.1 hypothetical protein [Exercitatus varius]